MKADPQKKRVAVIGAGFGGMALAARLAHAGYGVDIYERAAHPGGKAAEHRKDGFRFDAGPTVLTMPFVLEELYRDVNASWPENLVLLPQDLLCRYFYPDATRINAWRNTEAFGRELEAHTQDSAEALHRYMAHTRAIYNLSAPVFLFSPFPSRKTFASKETRASLSNPAHLDVLRSMHRANASFFSDPKSLMLFDRFATYNGSNPYKAPATLNQIFYVEHGLGACTVKGGIFNLSRHLQALAEEQGARFFFETNVEELITQQPTVTGLRTAGADIPYDAVVSNADILTTLTRLLKTPARFMQKRYEWLGLSSSALVFYWGVRGITPDLPLNALFFSPHYAAEFRDLFRKKRCPQEPTVYIHLSCRANPDDAPENHENWFVMVNAPPDTGQDWSAETERIRGAVLRRLEEHGISLRNRILFEEVLTPPETERRTGSFRGSLYGLSSNRMITAFLRHPARSRRLQHLYYCGGSVHPGGGMPLALLSAKLAADAVCGDLS